MKKTRIVLFSLGILLLFFIVQLQIPSSSSWKSWSLPLSGEIIVLDAGHGGPDGGAVGKDGTLEKDIALDVVLSLKEYLQQEGALVILTREGDEDLASPNTKGYSNRKSEDLKRRMEVVNESDANLFLTIHLNAIPSERWRGAQTFYNPTLTENKELAIFIQDEIRRNLENTDRYAKQLSSVYLLRNAEIPGALIEVGFLSNPQERELLKTDEYKEKVAASIYQGILRFYSNEQIPSQPPIGSNK